MNISSAGFARRIVDATETVFGDSVITHRVSTASQKYTRDVENILSGRGIDALLLAIVGTKGQGKTWLARQMVKPQSIKESLRSGDLLDDATTRLVWIGPVPPDDLEPTSEIYHSCASDEMVSIGQPYVLLDTPGTTDANHRAAKLATEALTLAPIKILAVARDQIRAAANMSIAKQIDGTTCILTVTSVEPEELADSAAGTALQSDLRSLREQLQAMAPNVHLTREVLVPDFEITGDENAASQAFVGALLDRFQDLGLTEAQLTSSREQRVQAASQRLKATVAEIIGDELPQLALAVDQLNRETEHVPQRVLDSLLGSETILETGVRMRLRARLVSDTSLIWFPYRTILSTLSLTQGAWDRVVLAMTGSVPSLFGALASWARNVRQSREVSAEIQQGIKKRTQEQVEERLQPLCHHFHRTVMKLRPRDERTTSDQSTAGMKLSGIEELQSRSQEIFESAVHRNATRYWITQLFAFVGVAVFWIFMTGPIVLVYKEYFLASISVLTGGDASLESFPHPTAGLVFTSLLLSSLPLVIYCMVVLTLSLSNRKVRMVARQIVADHNQTIAQLKSDNVIRLDFDDPLLAQAEYLLNLQSSN